MIFFTGFGMLTGLVVIYLIVLACFPVKVEKQPLAPGKQGADRKLKNST